jgi:uroporphyrinogen decarboxylase
MNMDMQKWIEEVLTKPNKKAMPVLSFPSVQLLGVGVPDLIGSADNQAKGMAKIAERTNALAAVSMMDLSVEAEMFGSEIRFSNNEVPTVVGRIISTTQEAEALAIPSLSEGRGKIYVEAIDKACKLINDRPVFAGVIGPFSLVGRLVDVTEIMMACFENPQMVHTLLKKITDFLIDYIKAYKAVGANGVVIADPLSGILSPQLVKEFTIPYLKQIIAAVESRDFLVIYHNCGNAVPHLIEDLLKIGANAYHFGNAVDLAAILAKVPENVLVMGNIDPASQFRNGTPESIRKATLELLNQCSNYQNFVISSGCDIPPLSPWANIDAFFAAVDEFYEK